MSHHSHTSHRPRPTWQQVVVAGQALSTANVRVGDAEREQATRALGEHYAAGRLDREEYDERLAAIFAARVGGDLTRQFADLPQPWPGQPRPARTFREQRVRHGFTFPFLPTLLILIGIAIFTGAAWVVWLGLGGLFLARKFAADRRRAQRRRQASWA